MVSVAEKVCSNCRYSLNFPMENSANFYICRRNPPSVVVVPVPVNDKNVRNTRRQQVSMIPQSFFPAVSADLSCGEWGSIVEEARIGSISDMQIIPMKNLLKEPNEHR